MLKIKIYEEGEAMLIKKRILPIILSGIMLLALCTPSFAANSKKLIAITFDDGPGKYTGELLDGLAARGAKATFFCLGSCASRYPDVLKRIVNEGHQLANHTQNHKNLNQLSAEEIRREVEQTNATLTAAVGEQTFYVRPPYGNANATVKSAIQAPIITWSVDPEDWRYRDASTVCTNIVSHAFDGAIVLSHDIYKTTVDGVLAAIDQLQAKGYEFVTVKELFNRYGVTPQNGVKYTKATPVAVKEPEPSEEDFDEAQITTHWGYSALNFCIERGWMPKGNNGAYLPNVYETRGAFITTLSCTENVSDTYGVGKPSPFLDITDDNPNAPYAKWAYDNHIVEGSDGNYNANDVLTREEIATMLTRYLCGKYDLSEGDSAAPDYKDNDKISSWAKSGVAFCSNLGILKGNTDGTFSPQGKLNRAQTASIVERIVEMHKPEQETILEVAND